MLRDNQLKNSLVENVLGILVDKKLTSNVSLQQRKLTASWDEAIFPLHSALVRCSWSAESSGGLLSTRETWTCWSKSSEGLKRYSCKEKLRIVTA